MVFGFEIMGFFELLERGFQRNSLIHHQKLPKMGKLIYYLCIASGILCLGVQGYNSFIYNKECGYFITQAAKASTIEIAQSSLKTAVYYLDNHGLANGNTAPYFETPLEDLGFYYRNLKASLANLDSIKVNATSTDISNTLIKLHESLSMPVPPGIENYPNNLAYSLWLWISIILAFIQYVTLKKNRII